MQWIGMIAGLALLTFGANVLVSGCVNLARHFKISKLLISSVIIGLGTSFPELFVSIKASLADSPEMLMGNIIGSNIANVFLVVGLAAAIYPILCSNPTIKREALAVSFASTLLLVLVFLGQIPRGVGFLMLLFLALYLIYSYQQDKKNRKNQEQSQKNNSVSADETEATLFQTDKLSLNLLITLAGLGILLLGAELLVSFAIQIATEFGIPEAVIGISLVAVGTSLPEVATAVAASFKKHPEIVLGNVIGSCIMNILFILGFTASLIPISISTVFLQVDIWVMLIATVLLVIPIFWQKPMGRIYGLIFLVIYGVYIAYLYGLFA